MKKFLLPLLFLVNTWLVAQNATLRGNVYDEETGNPIAYAVISIANNPAQGAITDPSGFFSIACCKLYYRH
jgi:hypothetical protein